MPSDDSRRGFPPNVEWFEKDGTIYQKLIHGDYESKCPAKTHHDVDPSLGKQFQTMEVFRSKHQGVTTEEHLATYDSTDVKGTLAGHTARQVRLAAIWDARTPRNYCGTQSSSQDAYEADLATRKANQLLQQAERQEWMRERRAAAQAKHEVSPRTF